MKKCFFFLSPPKYCVHKGKAAATTTTLLHKKMVRKESKTKTIKCTLVILMSGNKAITTQRHYTLNIPLFMGLKTNYNNKK